MDIVHSFDQVCDNCKYLIPQTIAFVCSLAETSVRREPLAASIGSDIVITDAGEHRLNVERQTLNSESFSWFVDV